ncbi:unnamed protein product [Effrenium voratum]|uniref:Calcineurin-like phosphoesterase domain-containing protein n=1 Tax=Effrenium voratum TaxID=2562239 RepID=A0AA36JBM1_9DINO|nr:unnamed protein product [Effrenium voratum]
MCLKLLLLACVGLGERIPKVEEVFIIGDLHADIHCAKHWVRRSGYVDLDAWTWTGGASALVFMGDYVDRGPFSRQVLELVRNLTTSFPEKVFALMGNHDLYFLADAVLPQGARDLMGAPVQDFSYAFIHPEEYLNWILPGEQAEASSKLSTLFAALGEVYAQQRRKRGPVPVMLKEEFGQMSIFDFAPLRHNATLSNALNQSLHFWQRRLARGALFVHGGLPGKTTREQLDMLGPLGDGDFSELFSSGRLDLLHEAVTYRGLHGAAGCSEVDKVLDLLPDIEMIVLGHTPGEEVRRSCGNRLVSADSALSRYYRAYGNHYCPVQVAAERKGACRRTVAKQCAGQASRLRGGQLTPVPSEPNPYEASAKRKAGRLISEANAEEL